MSTSQKHADFVSKSKIDNLPVEAIAGVGDKAKSILNSRDIFYAYQLIGVFLQLKRNEWKFVRWLNDIGTSVRTVSKFGVARMLSIFIFYFYSSFLPVPVSTPKCL